MSEMKFDSQEELYFSWWAEELQAAGYISKIYRDVEPYKLGEAFQYDWVLEEQLKTKLKVTNKSTKVLQPHIYTPDFEIVWAPKANGVFYENIDELGNPKEMPYFIAQDDNSLIEIKPAFDMQNMTRLATVNIKWVYDKFGDYVQKVVVKPNVGKKGLTPANALFVKTFTPKRYLMTDSAKQMRKIKFPVVTLEEFLNKSNGEK